MAHETGMLGHIGSDTELSATYAFAVVALRVSASRGRCGPDSPWTQQPVPKDGVTITATRPSSLDRFHLLVWVPVHVQSATVFPDISACMCVRVCRRICYAWDMLPSRLFGDFQVAMFALSLGDREARRRYLLST